MYWLVYAKLSCSVLDELGNLIRNIYWIKVCKLSFWLLYLFGTTINYVKVNKC